jgi:hypothetical protein
MFQRDHLGVWQFENLVAFLVTTKGCIIDVLLTKYYSGNKMKGNETDNLWARREMFPKV